MPNAESPSRVLSTSPCTESRVYIISPLFYLGIGQKMLYNTHI